MDKFLQLTASIQNLKIKIYFLNQNSNIKLLYFFVIKTAQNF